MPLRRFLWVLALAVALAASLAGRKAAAGPAAHLVENFNAAFIAIVKADDRTLRPSRFQMLNDRLIESFNLPVMMERATGPRWQTANEMERALVVDAFVRMSIATYLSRFENYSGEYFKTIDEERRANGVTLVTTHLVRPRRLDATVTYVTEKFDDDWRIVDVIIGGGISELALRKSEFTHALNRGGIPELSARLDQQAVKILAQLPAKAQREVASQSLSADN